jgi:hypothetical protein
MARTAKKPKRGFLEGYETYDPTTEGYGDPSEWKAAFRSRMGIDAARSAVGSDSPRSILGVSLSATWDDIKKAYRALARQFHPDLNPGVDAAKFRKIQGAFELLELEFGK